MVENKTILLVVVAIAAIAAIFVFKPSGTESILSTDDVYSSASAAATRATALGCEGSHFVSSGLTEPGFMPCESPGAYLDVTS